MSPSSPWPTASAPKSTVTSLVSRIAHLRQGFPVAFVFSASTPGGAEENLSYHSTRVRLKEHTRGRL
jgi:hypothetical protein